LADPASGSVDLWTLDLATSVTTQLTFAGPVEFYPVCSPSGTDMVFAKIQPDVPNLFRQNILAPGQATMVLQSPFPKIPTDWSRDGRQVIYSVVTEAGGFDIQALALSGGQPRVLVSTRADERNGKLSPDGRWLAYVSNENARYEVFDRFDRNRDKATSRCQPARSLRRSRIRSRTRRGSTNGWKRRAAGSWR